MHVGKQRARPAGGQPARAVGRVGFEHQSHLGPAWGDGDVVIMRELIADAVPERSHGTPAGSRGGRQGLGHRVGRMGGDQIAAHDLGRGGAHDRELVLEAGGEADRPRCEEVRDGPAGSAAEPVQPARRPDQRQKQAHVDRVQLGADPAQPRQVQGVPAGIGHRDHAAHGLGERRDPEAGDGEVFDTELEPDHLAARYIYLPADDRAMRSA